MCWGRAGPGWAPLQQVSSSLSPGAEKVTILNIGVLHVLRLPTEPAFTFKSDTTTVTKPTTTQGSRLTTPKPPSAETTGVIGNEPSQDQRQTTAKALGHTLSAPLEKPG